MAIPIQDIIPQFIKPQKDWKLRLMTQWPSIVGALQTRIRLEKIYDDATVVIGVYESHWMQELYLLSSVLIESMNDFLGARLVNAVRFVLIEEKPKSTRFVYRKSASKNLPDDRSLSEFQKRALHDICDDELKEALVQFLARTRKMKGVK